MAEPVRNIPKAPQRKGTQGDPGGQDRILAYSAGILFRLFCLLSIVLYGGLRRVILDDLSLLDAFRLPFDDQIKLLVADLDNGTGLFGAFTAHFFVDLTIGYFSLIFPLLMLMWCIVLLAGTEREKPVLATNYTLLFSFLFAASLGTLRYSVESGGKEWYGLVGAFTAEILVNLLGAIGALILLIVAIAAAAVYLLNVDLGAAVESFSALCRTLLARWRSRSAALPVPAGHTRPSGLAADGASFRERTLIRSAAGTDEPVEDGGKLAALDEDDVPVEYPGDESGTEAGRSQSQGPR